MSQFNKDFMSRLAFAESANDPNAVSPAGAIGLYQIMPTTDMGFGIGEVTEDMARDPMQAEDIARRYLEGLYKRYGNMDHTVAAYNWGPTNVDRWIEEGADPQRLPEETRNHIQKVIGSSGEEEIGGGQVQDTFSPNVQGLMEAFPPPQNNTEDFISYVTDLDNLSEARPDVVQSWKKFAQAADDWSNSDDADVIEGGLQVLFGVDSREDLENMSEQELANNAIDYMRATENQPTRAIALWNLAKNVNPEAQKELANVLTYWNEIPMGTQGLRGFTDSLLYAVSDPINITAGLLSGGVGAGAAKVAGYGGAKALLASLAAGGAVDALAGAGHDVAIQNVEKEIKLREDISASQAAYAGLFEATVGAVPGAVFGAIGGRKVTLPEEAPSRAIDDLINVEEDGKVTIKNSEWLSGVIDEKWKAADPEGYKGSLGFGRNYNITDVDTVKDILKDYDKTPLTETEVKEGANKLASELGITGKEAGQKILEQAQQRFGVTPEQFLAFRQLATDSVRRATVMAKEYQSARAAQGVGFDDTTSGATLKAAAVKAFTEAQFLVAESNTIARNAAQVLRMMQINTPSERVMADFFREGVLGAKGVDKVLEALAKGDKDALKAQRGFLGRTHDAILEWWYNSILGAPDTFIINFLGSGFANLAKNLVEAPTASLIGKVTRDAAAPTGAELGARLKGLAHGAVDGLSVAKQYAMHEHTTEHLTKMIEEATIRGDDPSVIGELTRLRDQVARTGYQDLKDEAQKGAIPNWLGGKFWRLPGRAMAVTDAFNKATARDSSLYAQAYKRVLTKNPDLSPKSKEFNDLVQESFNSPTEKMLDNAKWEAEKATFQNNNKFAAAITAWQNVPYFGDAVRYFIPFARTPVNLVTWGVERTPVLGSIAAKKDVKLGRISQSEIYARQVFGFSMFAAGYAMYEKGFLTGPGSGDYKQERVAQEGGWQPFAVEGASISRTDPVAMVIQAGAAFGQAVDQFKEAHPDDKDTIPEMTEMAINMVLGMSRDILLDKTYLKGMADMMDIITKGEADQIEAWAGRLGAGFVPNYINRVAQGMDEHDRYAKTALERIQARIPIIRESLPTKKSILGGTAPKMEGVPFDFLPIVKAATRSDQPQFIDMLVELEVPFAEARKDIGGVELTTAERDWLNNKTGYGLLVFLQNTYGNRAAAYDGNNKGYHRALIMKQYQSLRKYYQEELVRNWIDKEPEKFKEYDAALERKYLKNLDGELTKAIKGGYKKFGEE